jgi:hypothetical protein
MEVFMVEEYKNYVKLTFILSVTILAVVYALEWHKVYEEDRQNRVVIRDYIMEITMDEFINYINDNRDAVIYFGVNDNVDCRRFEKGFKNIITEYQLESRIIYINVSSIRGENFDQNLDILYGDVELRKQKRYLSQVPALTIFKNTKLYDFKSGEALTTRSALNFLKQYELIENMD